MKRFSSSLIIRNMQITTTMITPISMTIRKTIKSKKWRPGDCVPCFQECKMLQPGMQSCQVVPQNIKNRVLGSSSEAGYFPSMHEVQSPGPHTKELKIEFKKEKKEKSNKTPGLLIRTYAEELKAEAQRDTCVFMPIISFICSSQEGETAQVLSRQVHQ